jgi:alpha/beta superfamily hydrolase
MYLNKNSLPCILVSPPTAMFEVSLPAEANVWVIASDCDQFSDISKVKALVAEDRLTICRGIDHFWFGDEDVLTEKLNTILAGLFKPA